MKLGTHKLQLSTTLLALIAWTSLLGQFARLETAVGKVNIYEILMVFFMLFTIRKNLNIRSIFRSKIFWTSAVFIVWSVGITLFRSWPHITETFSGLAYLVRITLYAGFGWSVYSWCKGSKTKKHSLEQGITFWFIAMILLGIGQYLLLPDTRILAELGWDDHLSRAFGTLFDPLFFGCITALSSIWMFWHGLKEKTQAKTWLWAVGFAGSLLATTLSFSRSAYLAYMVAFLTLAFVLRQRKVLLAVPLLIMALVLVPKDGGGEGQKLLRTRSIEQRIEHSEYQTRDWTQNEMLFGRGWNVNETQKKRAEGFSEEYQLSSTPEDISQNHAQFVDSLYLQIWLASGFIGLSMFITLLFLVWNSQNTLGKSLLALVATHSLVSPSFFYPWILLVFICSIATQKKTTS